MSKVEKNLAKNQKIVLTVLDVGRLEAQKIGLGTETLMNVIRICMVAIDKLAVPGPKKKDELINILLLLVAEVGDITVKNITVEELGRLIEVVYEGGLLVRSRCRCC